MEAVGYCHRPKDVKVIVLSLQAIVMAQRDEAYC